MRFSTSATIGIICKPIWAREGAFGVQFLRRIGEKMQRRPAVA
jgi:hypothetical protein